ncbi:MAG TPA: NADP-dependent oxidoreductase [Thermoleophilaceae bacterium]|nr:NADP-dependent oxidoreductase [Thermoleophilaceae bacterium]
MSATTRELRLASRPQGEPTEANFELAETPIPEPGPGQVLIRNSYLSVDPYMRGRMRDVKSYIPPFEVGAVLDGGAVGQVIASNGGPFEEGAWVQHLGGWREHALSDGAGAYRVDPQLAPVSTSLGVLGMPGLTAYAGLTEIAPTAEGETVYVSAAAGAVGSTAGQIARLRGCRVVGSAGSREKVEWLTGELGFDAAFDYREHDVATALREHCPKGIDVYFDNVGGDHLSAALARMRTFGRIALCGAVSQYNEERPQPGPENFVAVLVRRLRIRGFIVFDHGDLMRPFLEEVGAWVRSGELRYRETIVDGLENMPSAFVGLLSGENIGKMLVRVGPDPDPPAGNG